MPAAGIKQGHAFGGKAIGLVKIGFEYAMERADDVVNDSFRGVVDAAALAFGGIILSQEGLVEVDDGVAALALVVVAVEDAGGVGNGEHFGDVVHAPGQLFGQITQRDKAEQIAQDADAVRDVVKGRAAAD